MNLSLLLGVLLGIVLWDGVKFLFKKIDKNRKEIAEKSEVPVQPAFDYHPQISRILSESEHIKSRVNNLPDDLLRGLTGLGNTHKGKLGELIGYITLKSQFDRILPLGTIVDFVGIKFPKDGKPGEIVFIDVKTGKNAKLNADQRALKKTIEEGQVSFVKINIDQIDVLDEKDGEPDTVKEP